ncbi:MAG TPA: tRNA lysidine(34) synthetase TilS, partial [Blastocatellia bacterium]|nr:tRNA lysidine(34) synthetase TilS [Blastocatellia bacterium]
MNGGTTEAVLKFIRRHRMFAASRGAVLAVSGGPDSTALLDILARLLLRANTLRAPDLKLSVAHLNHRLRGSESDQDALFVQQLGDKYGLPVFIGSADVRAESETSGRGIEETAREFRYAFLLEVANRTAADRIVTGHTMDDQAETFLLRLARGAGQRGLAGIRPVIAAHRFKTSLQFGLDLPSPGPGPNREEPHPVATRSGADAIGREPSRGD